MIDYLLISMTKNKAKLNRIIWLFLELNFEIKLFTLSQTKTLKSKKGLAQKATVEIRESNFMFLVHIKGEAAAYFCNIISEKGSFAETHFLHILRTFDGFYLTRVDYYEDFSLPADKNPDLIMKDLGKVFQQQRFWDAKKTKTTIYSAIKSLDRKKNVFLIRIYLKKGEIKEVQKTILEDQKLRFEVEIYPCRVRSQKSQDFRQLHVLFINGNFSSFITLLKNLYFEQMKLLPLLDFMRGDLQQAESQAKGIEVPEYRIQPSFLSVDILEYFDLLLLILSYSNQDMGGLLVSNAVVEWNPGFSRLEFSSVSISSNELLLNLNFKPDARSRQMLVKSIQLLRKTDQISFVSTVNTQILHFEPLFGSVTFEITKNRRDCLIYLDVNRKLILAYEHKFPSGFYATMRKKFALNTNLKHRLIFNYILSRLFITGIQTLKTSELRSILNFNRSVNARKIGEFFLFLQDAKLIILLDNTANKDEFLKQRSWIFISNLVRG